MMSTVMVSFNLVRQFKKFVVRKCYNFTRTAFSAKYLLYTNVCISCALSGAGDAIEQQYEIIYDNLTKWDTTRTKKMTISGLTSGVLTHYYYAFLDKRFPGRTIKVLMKKVLIDQLICSPTNISAFLITMAVLDGVTWDKFVKDFKHKGWRLYCADCIVWPPAQMFNFYFIQPNFRVLYDSTISLGYDIYTSYVTFDKEYTD